MRLPVIPLDQVYHIGTLTGRPSGGAGGGQSLEGHCLSVSLCPAGWQAIARLGGIPLYRLTTVGGRFLDVLVALDDPAVRGPALQHAQRAGWVRERVAWRSYSYDPEQEEWRYITCPTKTEARRNADPEGSPDDGGATVRRTMILGATPALERLLDVRLGLIPAAEYALLAWAETVLLPAGAPLDGVWWCERYDPLALSAPRGGIFPGQVARWRPDAMPWGDVPDDEELLASSPEPEFLFVGQS
jgi:hypothetical protein